MRIPMRRCVGCRVSRDKKELFRVALAKDGTVVPDPAGRLPGRGAYICFDPACLNKARRSRGMERSFGCSVGNTLYDRLSEVIGE